MNAPSTPNLQRVSLEKLEAFAIGDRARREIRRILPEGATILELGSGAGTVYLARFYEMFSIESEPSWIGLADSAYLHAPIVDGWYDRGIVETITHLRYDFLLIDGPFGGIARRSAMLASIHCFDLSVPILVDDAERPDERRLADELARLTGRTARVMQDGVKQFAIL